MKNKFLIGLTNLKNVLSYLKKKIGLKMSKPKDSTSDFRAKLANRKSESTEETPIVSEKKQTELEYTAYDIIQDPTTKSRAFLAVMIKYDPVAKKAIVADVRPYYDKSAGLTMNLDKENRKYLFEKNMGVKK